MDTQNLSAPSRAQSRVAGKPRPKRALAPHGITHANIRHTTRFTVIGNHLAQHPELSLVAIGLAAHIQSLPTGARVDIKTLTARFPEGATRIAGALRELEAHGYLRRERHRVPDGRIVTRTVSCNQPTAARRHSPAPVPPSTHPPEIPATAHSPRPKAPRPLPAVPHPSCPAPALLQQATDLLAGLHRQAPCLLLSAHDTAHLTPGVAAWLERDVTPTAVRQALTGDLPSEGVRRPAALLAHRLTALLPPPPPFRAPAESPAPVRHPLRNCDTCDRAYRGPGPGKCRDCHATGDTPAPNRRHTH
ncbi:helix-turn-helix domain-containing protein [Streptomyces antnestii]|uniref:Helix-turn-helix domain-containing protein n=1 Tax=Streptomyces antnestii TaxID=2494256 RepID=A0A3S2VPV8_9ACTN|nr:helix-turn-helix domain-containing protein [Streptomyces sp. San01]RVU17957.1 helix-turn-helix domain-containing protein [Streptomyces sp. San01]